MTLTLNTCLPSSSRHQPALGRGMRRLALAMACLPLMALAADPTPAQPEPQGALPPQASSDQDVDVQIPMLAWAIFWSTTRELPMSEQVARFKASVAPLAPGFYGLARHHGNMDQAEMDRRITKSIREFNGIKTLALNKTFAIATQMAQHVARMRQTFPKADTKGLKIVVLHTLGELDGGTLDFVGPRTLFFGPDVMARHHGRRDESAFLDRELFHLFHQAPLGDCKQVWCALWRKGLAMHVAQTLNPSATPNELLQDSMARLLDRPHAWREAALADLAGKLDSSAQEDLEDLFQTDTQGGTLPAGRGHVLGWWVARHLALTHDLQAMAAWDGATARRHIIEAIQALRAQPSP